MYEVWFWNGDNRPSVARFDTRKAAVKNYQQMQERYQNVELHKVEIRSWRVEPPARSEEKE